MRPIRLSLMLVFLCAVCTAASADIVDVTDRFTGLWNQAERATHHADGSITYTAKTWGGLSMWVAADWSGYDRLVFEFKKAPACDVQPVAAYQDGTWERAYTSAPANEATLTLNRDKRNAVSQVALQAAADATIEIARIYLVTDGDDVGGEDVDDSPEADEETDARLMINELMQSNIDCLMDDLNDFPDSWVELYNGGTTAARLSRYSMGITPDAASSWPLPDRKVKAGERIVVYCDKVADSLHTNFRLESAKGCQVYLFREGVLIDQVTGLKKQPAPNIAYGRSADGASTWGYQLKPTPGQPNGGGTCDADHILPEPLFSQPGRVFAGGSGITLTLSVPDGAPQGTVIRFTTDGTEPTADSRQYTQTLALSSSKVVRARLFCEGWLSPVSTTQSYLFLNREMTLPVVSIATDDQYLNSTRLGIFRNNDSDHRNNWRRPINIEFFFGDGEDAVVNQLCETRISGAASRGAAKKSMAIYANKRFGTKRFSHEFFPDQCPGLTEFKSLVLRNAGNDFDYLYMRDAIAQLSVGTHADLDWQAWQPAIVYINGSYHGMLNIRERANENNVYTHYDGLEDIDLIENWYDLKEGTWDNYWDFKRFYSQSGHTIKEYEERMDVTEFINLMVMNIFFCNFDFPGNNIIMWRPRAEGGRWRWIAKDLDFTMGLYGDPVDYKLLEWLYKPNYDSNRNWGANSSEATLLFRQLMDDADFHREFIDRAAIYMGDFLSEKGVRGVWDAMYDKIKFEYPYHRKLINEWWPNYSSELQTARNWLRQRPTTLYSQLSTFYNLGSPIPLTISRGGEETVEVDFNGVRLSEGAFNGMFFAGRDLSIEASAGQGKVSGWRVLEVRGSSSSSSEVSGSRLSMTMPSCSQLVLTPIVADDAAVSTLSAEGWTWAREGHWLYVSGVAPGVRVSLYDMRGMLYSKTTADGSDISLTIEPGHAYILKVGEKTIKIGY